METILVISAILIGPLILKRLIGKIRFITLFKRYSATFDLMSKNEKINFLYAEYGLRIREQQDIMSDDKDDYSMDYHFDNLTRIENSIPQYSNMSTTELYLEFVKYLKSHWEAMKLSGDYDFEATTQEIDLIIKEKEKLIAYVPKKKLGAV